MEYIYLGKIVGTHGIKGEIRLISDFEKKDLVFKPDFILYFGEKKAKKIINSYRTHKNYDMITLRGVNNINEVLEFKGEKVYFNREDLTSLTKDFLLQDLIDMHIISDNKTYGQVKEIRKTKAGILLYISYTKNYYIPYVPDYIKKVNLKQKEIEVRRVLELL